MTRSETMTATTRSAIDWQLVAAIIVFSLIGLLALWSGSIGFAIRHGGTYAVVGKQALIYAISLIVMAICAVLPERLLRMLVPMMVIAGLIGLLLPIATPLGLEINGARRWIRAGSFTLQPSELWKPVMVLYLAHFLDRRKSLIEESSISALPAVIMSGVSALLIFFQNDFSTSMLIIMVMLAVLFIGGVSLKFVLSLVVIGTLYGFLMIFSSYYRVERLVGFLMPDHHAQTVNYQMASALRAIRAGGLWGKGIGLGTLKLSAIPEVQSDFIFAAYVEETGFAGVLAVFLLWAFIVVRVSRRLLEADYFRRVAGFGLLTLLTGQILLNLAVVTGVVPTTGLALPFFSSGGTAVLMSAISAGFLVNFSSHGSWAMETAGAFSTKGVVHD